MPFDLYVWEFVQTLIAFVLGALTASLVAGVLLMRAGRKNAQLRQEVARLTTSATPSAETAKSGTPHRVGPHGRVAEETAAQNTAQTGTPQTVTLRPVPRPAPRRSPEPPSSGHTDRDRQAPFPGVPAQNGNGNTRRANTDRGPVSPATDAETSAPTQPVTVDPPAHAETSRDGNGTQPPAPEHHDQQPQQNGNGHTFASFATEDAAERFHHDYEEPMEDARRRIAELRTQLADVASDQDPEPSGPNPPEQPPPGR